MMLCFTNCNHFDGESQILIENILKHVIERVATRYYIKLLRKIKHDKSASDYLYDYSVVIEDQKHDEHIYHFAEDVNITICYSIPIIRKITSKENEKYITFENLRALLSYDLEQSKEHMDVLRRKIVGKRKHDSKFLIIMYHTPHETWLLLDGRHRFIEYEKFYPKETKVPVLVVDSEKLLGAILNRSGFIAYCVQHNLHILRKYPIRMWKKMLWEIHMLL